ncbi:MAG: AMP-binding protein, partial [Gaiellaceae bacterium]
RAIARNDPARIAIERGTTMLTYAELDEATESAAHALRERLGAGTHRVVLHLEDIVELAVASMAVARAGAVSVPVDPTVPEERIRRICRDVDASLLLSDSDLDSELAPVRPTSLTGTRPAQWEDVPPGEAVAIAFTSGSTGEPKGIIIPAAARPMADAGVDMSAYGTFSQSLGDAGVDMSAYGAASETLRVGLVSGGSSNVSETTLHSYLLIGATVAAYEMRREGIAGFANWLRGANVFVFTMVPTVLRHILPTFRPDDRFDSVRMVFLSGETTTWEDVVALRSHLHPEAVVTSIYGTTETGACLMATIDDSTEICSGPLPLGFPMVDRTVEILDELGRPVADGEIGQIVVTGPETSLGYWNRPEEAAGTFTWVSDDKRRVATGDLGSRLPDGNIEHHGRVDHVVKVAGNRIELGEVESALRALDGVADAAATTYLDTADDVRLWAAAVPAAGRVLNGLALRVELARILPAAHLPDGITVLASLPLLPGGKVDRGSLPVEASLTAPIEPATERERELLAVWQEVLGNSGIGVGDDFFALGGDSLRAASVIVGVHRLYGIELPVSILVEAPTVRSLAAVLEAGMAWSPLVPVRGGIGPAFFVVHDGSGDVVYARLLAEGLPAEMPVYGLRGRALDGSAIPEQGLAELSASYVRTIRSVQPEGPYHLYGMSAGGSIAFEMARQLEESGATVGVVAIGDTAGPGGFEEGAVAPEPHGMRVRLVDLRGGPQRVRARRILQLAIGRVRRIVHRRLHGRAAEARRDRNAQAIAAALEGGDAVPIELREGFAMMVYGSISTAYTPATVYDGQVTVIRAVPGATPIELWQRWTTHPLHVVEVEGRHPDLGREPAVGRVARALADALADAQNPVPAAAASAANAAGI